MEKQAYMLLALSHINRVGRRTLRLARLLGETVDFSSCTPRDIQKMLEVTPEAAERIKNEFSLQDAVIRAQKWAAEGIDVLTQYHSEYPNLLREIPDPPEILYITGNKDLLHRPAIAVIGRVGLPPMAKMSLCSGRAS